MSTTSVPSLVPPDAKTYETNLNNSLSLIRKILSVQSESISHVSKQYQFNEWSKRQLTRSLKMMNDCLLQHNKIVVSGIGKSFKIANKIVATLNSLSLHSSILHPSDALHGDLGLIRDGDVLILISASGSSSELVELLTHLDASKIDIILLTCNPNSILSNHEKVSSLIYLELPTRFKEENIYGLTAPTISTTLLLTLMDSVCILLNQLYISDSALRKVLFGERHPGGAIGQLYSSSSSESVSLLDFNVKHVESVSLKEEYDDQDESQIGSQEFDFDLISQIKDKSKKIVHIDSFPKSQLELFEILVKNDIIIYGKDKGLRSDDLIKVIRQTDDSADIKELEWRVSECFKKINLVS